MHKFTNCLTQAAIPMLIALSLLILAAHPADATPLLWNLNNVAFDDGGQANGFFIYDDDTHTITSANITTTAGNVVQFNTSYDASIVDRRSTTSHLVFWNGFFTSDYTYTEWYELNLPLTQPMTNDGGEIPLALGQQSYDEAFVFGLHLIPPAYCDFCVDRRFVSGSIVAEQPAYFTVAKPMAFASAASAQEAASAAPEPSTLALLSTALCGFGLWGRRRQSRIAQERRERYQQ